MQHNFITNLLDLKGVIVKKVRYKKNFVKIHIELPVREQTCPHCKEKTTKIKNYRIHIIKRTYQLNLKALCCHIESVDINVKNVGKHSMKKHISYLREQEKQQE